MIALRELTGYAFILIVPAMLGAAAYQAFTIGFPEDF